MPEIFVLQPSENHPNRQPSPMDKDRYTPVPSDANLPYRSSPPLPMNSTSNRPEFYHLNGPQDKPTLALPSPTPASFDQPQSYPTNQNDHRSSPTFPLNNRVSPTPRSNLKKQGPEMYHLVAKDDPQQPIGPPKTTRFNEQGTRYDVDDDRNDPSNPPGKVTVFTISAATDENNPPPPPASPPIRPMKTKQQPMGYDIINDENKYPPPPASPPIRPAKGKQQQPPPFAYDIVNDENNYPPPPSNRQRAFPTNLQDVSANIRYVPLEQSKATESIARSMIKYRFGGY